MPLTPQDVSNKRFTPVRLREGYDMGEVDQFLDEVEAELGRLTQENQDLRSKLGTEQDAPAAAGTDGAETTARPAAPAEEIRVTTAADAARAATRLLEIATRNADELVSEAQQQADTILTEARTGAEQAEAESKERVERLESDARTRSQMLDDETEERRQRMFGDLENDKHDLDREVERLRAFEREYRSRLKTYFEQQLAALDGVEPSSTEERSLLDEDEDEAEAERGDTSEDEPAAG
jgi:DivIVA domain-containing protein